MYQNEKKETGGGRLLVLFLFCGSFGGELETKGHGGESAEYEEGQNQCSGNNRKGAIQLQM